MRLGLVGAVAVLAVGCAHRIECRDHGGPVWRELRTQHFSMLTDLPQETAHQEALDLEELRLALRFHFQLPSDSDEVTRVIYLADVEELEEFVPLAGYAHRDDVAEREFIVSTWAPPKSWRRSHTIPHELAHRYSEDAFVSTAPWLEEGIASYLESVKLAGPYSLWLGGVSDRFGFRGRLRSLEELWASPWFPQLSGADQALAYASSWAWVHYLVNHEPARWAAFTEQRRKGIEIKKAFLTQFPEAEWTEIQAKVEAYKDQAQFTIQKLEFKYQRRILEDRELPSWQVHLIRRDLESGSQGSAEERQARMKAEATTARALAKAPVQWAVLSATTDDDGELQAAAEANPGDYEAQVWLSDSARRKLRPFDTLARAKAALALNPNGVSALLELGLGELIINNDLDAAARALERGHQLAPGNARLALAIAQLRSRQRRCAEVPAWVERAKVQAFGRADRLEELDQRGRELVKNCEAIR